MKIFAFTSCLISMLTTSFFFAQCPTTTISCIPITARVGTVSSQGGAGLSWTGSGNAFAADGSFATISASGSVAITNGNSQTITANTFGYTSAMLPSYKYVCGMSVTVTRHYTTSGTVTVTSASDNTISVGGVAIAGSTNAWGLNAGSATYGGIGTGAGTSAASITTAGFGVNYTANVSFTTALGTITGRLDGFSVTVYVHDTVITPCPLPVTLNYFKGKQDGNCVNLSWRTETEIHNDHFIIEKLIGDKYVEIGRVDSKSTDEQVPRYYDFTDCSVSKMNYYRLVQVDTDGHREVTGKITNVPIVKVLNDDVSIAPNPAQDMVCVGSKTAVKGIDLFGSDGRLIHSSVIDFYAEQSCLDIADYEKGVYNLVVTTADGVFSKRLTIE